MGTINFDKFRQKLEQSKTKKTSVSQFNWMKLDAGKRYTLRFLPLKSENLELPISIYHHHAITFPDGHFESIACPRKSEDGECPFCNYASQLWRKFTKTENEDYKKAAKDLFTKTHYLLVGYEPSELDTSDIKPEDLKIVRASSKANIDLIDSKLYDEIDFVDFSIGRNIKLTKTKGTGKDAITNITWDFGDPSIAFDGKNGRKVFDELIEKSPDLSSLVKPFSAEKLQEKFNEFLSTPVASDEDHDTDIERDTLLPVNKPISMTKTPAQSQQKILQTDSDELPFDLEDMKRALESN